MRLFISVDLSEGAKREMEKLLKKLEKKHWFVRWEPLEKLHVTLAFLGPASGSGYFTRLIQPCPACRQAGSAPDPSAGKKVRILREIIEKAKKPPFIISFKGLGCFPDYVFPEVVWLGLKGDLKSLAALRKEIQGRLIKQGFKPNAKPFVPHITLGRIKKDCRLKQRQEIGRQLKAMRELKFQREWYVDRVTLYQSRCLPQGSVYKKLAEAKLPIDK